MTEFGLAIRNFVGPGEVPDVEGIYRYAERAEALAAKSPRLWTAARSPKAATTLWGPAPLHRDPAALLGLQAREPGADTALLLIHGFADSRTRARATMAPCSIASISSSASSARCSRPSRSTWPRRWCA